ncbi:hypothetical protein P5V15_001038 [Pogonomyrmex californicus]
MMTGVFQINEDRILYIPNDSGAETVKLPWFIELYELLDSFPSVDPEDDLVNDPLEDVPANDLDENPPQPDSSRKLDIRYL